VNQSEDILVAGADQRCEIPHRTKIGLDDATLALDGGLLDLQVGKGLCLDRKLIGKAVALRLPSSAVRSLEIGNVPKVLARTERRWGRRKKVQPQAPTLLAERQNVSSCSRTRPIDSQR
jgi:hypothetical protein